MLTVAHASDESEAMPALKKLIIEGSTSGTKPNVYINFLGKPARVQIVAADDNGVSAMSDGSVLPVGWKEISAEQLGGLASEFAKSGPDFMNICRYYVQNKLNERAEKAALSALEHDKSLTSEVGAVLGKAEPKAPLAKTPAPAAPPAAAGDAASSSSVPAAPSTPGAPGETEKPKSNLAGLTGFGSSPSSSGPRLPDIKTTIMFDTPEADIVMAALQIFPKSNAWNEDISKNAVLPESDKLVAHIGADKHMFLGFDFSFIIVPPDQPKVDAKIISYSGESDKGPYPLAPNTPIEGWPCFWQKNPQTLDQIQREGDGDRHAIVIDAVHGIDYEFFELRKVATGWQCGTTATFNLNSNKLRPKNWTSADAAGLAMLPGLIRHDEIQRGVIDHAIRMTVTKTRKAFIYPATHHAGATDDPTFPAMGQRFRLKASVDISSLPKDAQIIATAMKKYGVIVADNGSDWYICATTDKRFNHESLKSVSKLKGSDFEAVQTTGERP
jgi:hypothetical protein